MEKGLTPRQLKRFFLSLIIISVGCGVGLNLLVLTRHASLTSRMLPAIAFLMGGSILLCVSALFILFRYPSFARTLIHWINSSLQTPGTVFLLEVCNLLTLLTVLAAVYFLKSRLITNAYGSTSVMLVWLGLSSVLFLTLFLSIFPLNEQIRALILSFSWKKCLLIVVLLALVALASTLITNILAMVVSQNQLPPTSIREITVIGVFLFEFACLAAIFLPRRFANHLSQLLEQILTRLNRHPALVSLAITIIFFVTVFIFFCPAYGSYDETIMVSVFSGYVGGKIQPMLIHSNVLAGLILAPLARLIPSINWLMLFYVLINFLSLWALIDVFLSMPLKSGLQWVGILSLLLFDIYFLTSLTFTTTGAFAATAGLSLILAAIRWPDRYRRFYLISGPIIILLGALIRLESALLVIGMAAPLILLAVFSCNWKRWLPVGLVTILLISSATAFNWFYSQQNPDWSQYIAYDQVRVSIDDTPRLENITLDSPAMQAIQWSKNDLWLFSNWFFPDKQVFSYDNLKYLADHTPAQRNDPSNLLSFFGERLFFSLSIPYFIILLAVWVLVMIQMQKKMANFTAYALLVVFLSANIYLCWVMKLPFRVLIPMQAATAVFLMFVPVWFTQTVSGQSNLAALFTHFVKTVLAIVITLAAIAVLVQTITTAIDNRLRREAYQQILSGISALQTKGEISAHPLLLSNGIGIPLEWSDPLKLNFPPTYQYLVTGWLAFSPSYQATLQKYGVQSVMDSLYLTPDVYLVTRPNFITHITQFIKEHQGVDVRAIDLYTLPINGLDRNYLDTRIYKLVPAKP